ncbi:MAG TPA: formate/nitrite transporter family protein [Acidobacteriota bacterium]|nr:formate/nitrite transporter family protein [Acidobacteriota bacterium]HNT17883.1 formate/nitrite transporter family protein [Acidobacteriota bacterium]HPA27550.1 formate/nitrite transporter family protein [Acidobacteriota bacterium]HQO20376.1 formate/nitrite transporter family protein [Acidobacteriota bacterium]HQQ47733.1 formate/nitrite transporter family protein [Acidobacteriota bacterium]
MANKPVEIIQAAINAGCYKCKLEVPNYLLRSFMAGLYIAVGAALATVCGTGLETIAPGLKSLIAGAVFPVGLIAIVLTGMELFTGDAMLCPLAAMEKKSTWSRVMQVWLWVYIGNFIGSLFWAYLMSVGPLSKGGTAELTVFGVNAVGIAQSKVIPYMNAGMAGWWSAFMKGIACNLLVNVAILLAFSSKTMIGKFFGIWFPIMAFVSSGFEHSVANMYFIPVGIFCGAEVTWGQFINWNLIPVTIGNIIGGFLFVGVVYYLAFKKELPKEA